ncbi:MAG: 5-methyltetrahydrofolate--homocysteine methyltransferase [Prevotellaceae bacterium]|nr:5-methyltetrahydrofolate--homocysteine methyltransferase [Prevotellaceae bacterium]
MSYIPIKPNKKGFTELMDIDLRNIVPFINRKFFFRAWRLGGNYPGIASVCDCGSCKTSWLMTFDKAERDKAEEALMLYRDAQAELRTFLNEHCITVNAVLAIYDARSENDDIIIDTGERVVTIPTLRQQTPSLDGYCYALSDFLSPTNDYIGIFATTVHGAEKLAEIYESEGNTYRAILAKTLADRLAEASAEYLHYQVRTKYWGYVPDEAPDVSRILKARYQGIRPAVGYPSLPDQSVIFDLDAVVDFRKIGIRLTENGAMYPNASVCGLYFAHPASKYFMVGKIDDEQLNNYALRRHRTAEEMRKWLVGNIKSDF